MGRKLGHYVSEETKNKIRIARAKQVFSKESQIRKGLSLSKWNKEHPEKIKERGLKIGLSKLGHLVNEETKKKISISKKGQRCSLSTEFKRGLTPWNKGIKYSPERLEKCRETTKKLMTPEFRSKLSKIRKERIALGLIKIPKGKEAPTWLGGKSFEPYDYKFNKEFKNLVRLRDNFCCLNCGLSEQVSLIVRGRRLSIHHIDYNKLNTYLQNCCSLCTTCNNKANFNRSYWINHFRSLLANRHNYQYEKELIVG